MSAILSTAALLGSLAATASAHGFLSGVQVGQEYYPGYDIAYTYQPTPPVVAGWSHMNQDNGYVADINGDDIICHKESENAGTSINVNGGDKVSYMWNTWPESHKGPIITYLAKCDGECEKADKKTLKWFKIDEGAQTASGWVTDDMIANNNTYSLTFPDDIASGNYVSRHEIIALHSAGQEGGAQNYPYCTNFVVKSSGSAEPEGTLGTELYTAKGLVANIYGESLDYTIPGPALYSGASSGSGSASASSQASTPSATAAASSSAVTTKVAVATSSAAAATTTAAATSATATSAAAPSSTAASGSAPSVSIPEGTDLKTLLGWIEELFEEKSANTKRSVRAHPRQFN